MRKLSIKSGHAFLLVYSVTSALSLEVVKLRLQEIVDTKENPEVNCYYSKTNLFTDVGFSKSQLSLWATKATLTTRRGRLTSDK